MRIFFTILIISICSTSSCFALGLELSDIIKEAREIEKAKLSENKIKDNSIQPVKNTQKNIDYSKEKIKSSK